MYVYLRHAYSFQSCLLKQYLWLKDFRKGKMSKSYFVNEYFNFRVNVHVLRLIRPAMDCSHFFGVEFDAAILIFSRFRKSLANLSVVLVSNAWSTFESNARVRKLVKNEKCAAIIFQSRVF